jgi:pimeloyl-ACP methyl ester carboxylesterase
MSARPVSRRVPGSDGLWLALREWSDTGPPLVFLHGFGHDSHVWDPFAPDFAACYRTLALDARGHGDSDHDPQFRYHHAALARDIEAVLDALGGAPATLVAHSMSGYASIRVAARSPGRIERLVLVDAGPQLAAAARSGAEREPAEASYADPGEYARALARSHPRVDSATLERLARHWLRARPDGRLEPKLDPAFLRPRSAADPEHRRSFDRGRWAREETARLWKLLARVACPTLVVHGEHSPMLSRATVERMLGVLADGRAVAVPGAGHAVLLEAPEAFRAALRDFLLPALRALVDPAASG